MSFCISQTITWSYREKNLMSNYPIPLLRLLDCEEFYSEILSGSNPLSTFGRLAIDTTECRTNSLLCTVVLVIFLYFTGKTAPFATTFGRKNYCTFIGFAFIRLQSNSRYDMDIRILAWKLSTVVILIFFRSVKYCLLLSNDLS